MASVDGPQLIRFPSPLTPNKDAIDHFEISQEHRFESAKIEWFIALGWAFGVVGAVWAVWAKLKADQAFMEAQNAAGESYKAFNAATDAVTQATEAASQSRMAVKEATTAAKHALDAFGAVSTRPIDFDALVKKDLERLVSPSGLLFQKERQFLPIRG
jgi:hypothetical protein